MKILVAEDDAISRKLLTRRLEKWGHQVIEAKNGKEAWELYRQSMPDMVISDWMMPEMDGVELIQRIRSDQVTPYAYTIILTAKSQKEDLVMGMEAGADDFLTKPFDADELKMRLRSGERIIDLQGRLTRQNRYLEKMNRRMRQELSAAAKIQMSLLPKKPPAADGVNFAWYFKPCEELAGDIFNVFPLDRENVGLYVLDVSGHGVAAALRSVTLSHLLSPVYHQSNLLLKKDGKNGELLINSPEEVVNQLNAQFPLDLESGQFFTILFGILNLPERRFTYVSAGHPGMLYLNAGQVPRVLETASLPIGFDENFRYRQETLLLHPGDRLVVYSDGIVEALNPQSRQFGKQRLGETLMKLRNLPLERSLSEVIGQLVQWTGNEQFDDDITLLALEVAH